MLRSRRESRVSARIEPTHLLAAVFAAVTLVKVGSASLIDPDAPWHVLLGGQILSGVPPWQAAQSWTFAPVADPHWVSTEWLAEVVMAVVHDVGGWNGLLVFRLTLAVALLAILAATLLPGRPARAAVPVFLLVTAPILLWSVQERPQSISFLLLVPLSWWALGIVRQGRLPRVWIVLPLALLWANVHGLWVMMPAVLGLAAVGRWLDHGLRDRAAAQTLALTAASFAMGLLTPAGVATLTAAWRFRQAAALVTEWGPVRLLTPEGVLLLLYATLIVVAWARGRTRPERSELLLVGSLLVLATTAYRNIPTALLLTAPFVVTRVVSAWQPRRATTSLRERRWLVALSAGTLAVGIIAGLLAAALRSPFPADAPIYLSQVLSGRPEATRVLPDTDESGWILSLAGTGSRTAIDGRTDLFGASYINDYLNLLQAGNGWEKTLRGLDPSSAVLRQTTPLTKVLRQCGWRVEASSHGQLLLVPTPGWTCPADSASVS